MTVGMQRTRQGSGLIFFGGISLALAFAFCLLMSDGWYFTDVFALGAIGFFVASLRAERHRRPANPRKKPRPAPVLLHLFLIGLAVAAAVIAHLRS